MHFAPRHSVSPWLRLLAIALPLIAGSARPASAEEPEARRVVQLARFVVREAAVIGYDELVGDRLYNDEGANRYGLKVEPGWERVAAPAPGRPLVVLIHGFNSTCERNAAILEPIRAAGYACSSFSYPNDWGLVDSAQLLSSELAEFAAEHPNQAIALVTHSMGGLVARECIENSALDPGNVTRLVMIAPPTHGTLVANFADGADLWEHLLDRRDGSPLARLRDAITDGLGEAGDDLVPGSPFLTALNARPRNKDVRYSIFLGSDAGVAPWQRELARLTLQHAAERSLRYARPADALDRVLADADELVDGQGDGVVAVKRGRLAGVDDTVILDFDHIDCTGPGDSDAVRQLHAEVVARLH